MDETKTRGWWHAFTDQIPKDFGLFVSLEDAATHMTSYQTTFLPGLLHTRDYRRALSWTEFPHKPSDETERLLDVGMKRQARLTSARNPITLNVLIDESILRRMTGSTEVMAAQLRHLIDCGQLPNVSIRVVPSKVGTYRGLIVGSFVLLEFPPHPKADLTMSPVVYIQGFTGDLYLEKPVEVDHYRGACADIERLALDENASRALLLDIAKEYAR